MYATDWNGMFGIRANQSNPFTTHVVGLRQRPTDMQTTPATDRALQDRVALKQKCIQFGLLGTGPRRDDAALRRSPQKSALARTMTAADASIPGWLTNDWSIFSSLSLARHFRLLHDYSVTFRPFSDYADRVYRLLKPGDSNG